MTWISKNRPTKKQDLIDALDDLTFMVGHPWRNWQEIMSEQIGRLRSLVDRLPEDK